SVSNMSTKPRPWPCTSSSRAASCFAYVTTIAPPTFWIPNGANPRGTFGSTNAPGMCTWPKLPSKTSTWQVHVILTRRVLLRVRDDDRAADILDSERREPARYIRIDERTGNVHLAEAPVEDIDLAVVEVGRVQAIAGEREALEDRVLAGEVSDHLGRRA